MANPCAPRPSVPKAGVQNVVTFGSIALGGMLNNRGVGWLAKYGFPAALGTMAVATTDFCQNDPPTLTCPSALDIANWFNPLNPSGAAQLRAAMIDLVQGFLWYELCTCSPGPDPVAPVACGEPASMVLDPPTLLTPVLPTPCASNNQPSSIFNVSPQTNPLFSVGSVALPANASSVECSFLPVGTTQALTVQLQFKTEGGAVIQTLTEGVIAPGAPGFSMTEALPVGCREVDLILTWAGAQAGTARYTWTAACFCAGQIAGVPAPQCCAPDPQLAAMLSQLLAGQAQLLGELVLSPPSFTTLVVTPGLSGEGELILNGDTRALAVTMTTIPTQLGRHGTEPVFFFDAGFLAYYNGSANRLLGELHYQNQHFDVPPGVFRVLEYSLHSGVIIEVLERGYGGI